MRPLAQELHDAMPAPIRELAAAYWDGMRAAFYDTLALVRPDEKPDGSIPTWKELDPRLQGEIADRYAAMFKTGLRAHTVATWGVVL